MAPYLNNSNNQAPFGYAEDGQQPQQPVQPYQPQPYEQPYQQPYQPQQGYPYEQQAYQPGQGYPQGQMPPQGYPQGYFLGGIPNQYAQEGTQEWAQQRYPNVANVRPDYVVFLEGAKKDYDFDKAQAFHHKQFSILAFLFSLFYFLYRKMWLEAAGFFALTFLVGMTPLDGMDLFIAQVALWALAGFAFYPLWRRRAEQTWQRAQGVHGANLPAIVNYTAGKGGVSVVALVIALAVYLIVYVALLSTVGFDAANTITTDLPGMLSA